MTMMMAMMLLMMMLMMLMLMLMMIIQQKPRADGRRCSNTGQPEYVSVAEMR